MCVCRCVNERVKLDRMVKWWHVESDECRVAADWCQNHQSRFNSLMMLLSASHRCAKTKVKRKKIVINDNNYLWKQKKRDFRFWKHDCWFKRQSISITVIGNSEKKKKNNNNSPCLSLKEWLSKHLIMLLRQPWKETCLCFHRRVPKCFLQLQWLKSFFHIYLSDR